MPFNRGDIYIVNFDPQEENELAGSEMKKKRPAVVVSPGSVGRPGLYIVVPLTTGSKAYRDAQWVIPVPKTGKNGLREHSWADASQVKSVSEKRFVRHLGRIESKRLDQVVAMIAFCVGYRPTRLA